MEPGRISQAPDALPRRKCSSFVLGRRFRRARDGMEEMEKRDLCAENLTRNINIATEESGMNFISRV
jgi:hypothetical protein